MIDLGAEHGDAGPPDAAQRVRPIPSRSALRVSGLDEELRTEGFAVLDIADRSIVDRLSATYAEVGPTPGDPGVASHQSFLSKDSSYRRRVSEEISASLSGEIERVFDDYRLVLGSFIVKWPGRHSGFGLHQDLTFVDERHCSSYIVWIPLEDVTLEAGPLWVVPRSHRWRLDPRGLHGVPFAFADVVERVAERATIPLELRRGQMVIFDNGLVHGSTRNETDAPRVVALGEVVPTEATVVQYFRQPDGSLAVAEIDDDGFWFESVPLSTWVAPGSAAAAEPVFDDMVFMTHEELDGLFATGLAIDTGGPGPGPINATDPVCFRCTRPVVGRPIPSPWIDNVTLLCHSCERAEAAS